MSENVLSAEAEVVTERGDRWLKQLATHSGRKVEVIKEDDRTLLFIAGGTCTVTSDQMALRLTATGSDEASLTRVQEVVGGHLERIAANEGLHVVWQRVQPSP